MSERRDVIISRAVGTKRYYTKIGVAFFNDNGSVSIKLEALPMNGDMFIPVNDRDRQQGSRGGQQRRRDDDRQQRLQERIPDQLGGDSDDDFGPDPGDDDIPY